MVHKCPCQDSTGKVCGKEMTSEEYEQDGMCWNCADNVWSELKGENEGWTHDD